MRWRAGVVQLTAALGATGLLAVAGAGCGSSSAARRPAADLLPDLAQTPPMQLAGTTRGHGRRKRFLLGFGSAVTNVGAGPLIVRGRRPSRKRKTMIAEQFVRTADGSERSVGVVGLLHFVHSKTHSHWHLLRFDRYELRRADDDTLVRPDRKTGFCLGDRYDADPVRRLAHEPKSGVWVGECGKHRPGLLRVAEGISVGYGDYYKPQVEGQYIDLTRVPAGRYELVHRVNADGRLRESNAGNDVASLLFTLGWPNGFDFPPSIDVIARCPATAHCGLP